MNKTLLSLQKQNTVWKYLEENHLFAHTYEQQTMDEKRELTVRRINTVIDQQFLTLADVCFILPTPIL